MIINATTPDVVNRWPHLELLRVSSDHRKWNEWRLMIQKEFSNSAIREYSQMENIQNIIHSSRSGGNYAIATWQSCVGRNKTSGATSSGLTRTKCTTNTSGQLSARGGWRWWWFEHLAVTEWTINSSVHQSVLECDTIWPTAKAWTKLGFGWSQSSKSPNKEPQWSRVHTSGWAGTFREPRGPTSSKWWHLTPVQVSPVQHQPALKLTQLLLAHLSSLVSTCSSSR